MTGKWVSSGVWERQRKVLFTPDLLERIGASGKTMSEVAKELGVSQQLISKHINKNLTNREAYERGKATLCQMRSKNSIPANSQG